MNAAPALGALDALVMSMHATARTVHDVDPAIAVEIRGMADAVSDCREGLRLLCLPRQSPEMLARIVTAKWRE